MVLRRVGILSAGKIMGALGVFMGLIVGGFMALVSLLGIAMPQPDGDGAAMPMMFMGVGALILAPIVYGIMFFIAGIIYAAIYNLVAGVAGGLELDFDASPPQV